MPCMTVCRPTAFSEQEEALLHGVVLDYAQNPFPLTVHGLQDAAEHLMDMMPASRRAKVQVKLNNPSRSWTVSFLRSHKDL